MSNSQQLLFMLRFGCQMVGVLGLAFGIGTFLKYGNSDDITTRSAIVLAGIGTFASLMGWLLSRRMRWPVGQLGSPRTLPGHDSTGWRSWHFYCASAFLVALGLILTDLGSFGKGGYDWKALAGIILVIGGIGLFFRGSRQTVGSTSANHSTE